MFVSEIYSAVAASSTKPDHANYKTIVFCVAYSISISASDRSGFIISFAMKSYYAFVGLIIILWLQSAIFVRSAPALSRSNAIRYPSAAARWASNLWDEVVTAGDNAAAYLK